MKTKNATERKSGAAVRSSDCVGPDWQRIATERLAKLKELEHRCVLLRDNIQDELQRELSMQLHARCIPRNAYEDKLDDIANFVAERLRPKLYGRFV